MKIKGNYVTIYFRGENTLTIVFKVSDNVKEKMINYYKDHTRPKTPEFCSYSF